MREKERPDKSEKFALEKEFRKGRKTCGDGSPEPSPDESGDPSAHGILAQIFSEIIFLFPTHLCMTQATEIGHSYRRKLPHYRTPGAIYHARFALHLSFGVLKMARDFLIFKMQFCFGTDANAC